MPWGTGGSLAQRSRTTTDNNAFGQGNAGAVAVLPAAADRINVVVTALAGNADTVRIGGADVDTNRGTPLAPGDTIALPIVGEIFVCSEGAGANAVALNELIR